MFKNLSNYVDKYEKLLKNKVAKKKKNIAYKF